MCENTTFPARDTTDTLQSRENSNNRGTDKTATCTLKDGSIICMLMQYTASVKYGLKPLQHLLREDEGNKGVYICG